MSERVTTFSTFPALSATLFCSANMRTFSIARHRTTLLTKRSRDGWIILQELKPVDGTTEFRNPLMSPRGIAVDEALALGRLALLEERRGRTDTADDFWRRAVDEARVANWKDDSESGVRAVLGRLDNCQGRAPKP